MSYMRFHEDLEFFKSGKSSIYSYVGLDGLHMFEPNREDMLDTLNEADAKNVIDLVGRLLFDYLQEDKAVTYLIVKRLAELLNVDDDLKPISLILKDNYLYY